MRANRKQDQLRQRIANLAAQNMLESGIRDFQLAKRKAAAQLHISENSLMPSNQEVEQALIEYQSLFHGQTQPQKCQQLRQTALKAMQFFHAFKPRLTGDVLSGCADKNSRVELHLFADYPEQVGFFLMNEEMPYEEKSRRLRFSQDSYIEMPVFTFIADDTPIELVVFPAEGIRQAPISPVDGKPMQRAGVKAVELLVRE